MLFAMMFFLHIEAFSAEAPTVAVTEEAKLDPKEVAKAEELVSSAKKSAEKGDREGAWKFVQESVSLYSGLAEAHELRAELAVGFKKNDEAIQAYRAFLKLMPQRDDARKRLGNVLMRHQRYAEAVVEYDVVLKGAPEETAVRYNMARCQAISGKNKEALASLKLCVEKNPQYRQTANGDPAFGKLKADPKFQSLISQ